MHGRPLFDGSAVQAGTALIRETTGYGEGRCVPVVVGRVTRTTIVLSGGVVFARDTGFERGGTSFAGRRFGSRLHLPMPGEVDRMRAAAALRRVQTRVAGLAVDAAAARPGAADVVAAIAALLDRLDAPVADVRTEPA